MIEDLWYKNAVVYCLDVEKFQDGDGDGIGDFRGLTRRLDYLAGLGITCLWLLPFYPTPNRDNGYDISDFYGVDDRLGDLGDFVSFTHQARLHGIRVIVDLVVNHTSDRHPWFQAARKDPKSPFRDYYVWSKKKPKNAHTGMVFPGVQKSTWTYDDVAGEYFFHRFFDFQPDLNTAHPAVREEIFKIMGYWLQLGVSGFRVDAVPFVIEPPPLPGYENARKDFDFLRELREFLSWKRGDAILLAEANVLMPEVKRFFGAGDRFQMVFNFQANQHFYEGLVREDARPLAKALRSSPRLAPTAQWANFLRNHDELDLGRLSEEARQQVFDALGGGDDGAQIYGRGLRRRIASMLDGDPRRLQLAFSLMFSLPGTPVLWYGDEIGMGERLSLEEREAVRTPMQWSPEDHAGFTRAKRPVTPLVDSGPFSFERINVAVQRRQPESMLNWMERIIRLRKECPEIGWGSWTVLRTGKPSVLAVRHQWREAAMITVHNLSSRPQTLHLSGGHPEAPEPLVDLLTGLPSPPDGQGRHKLTLEGYGYKWFRVGGEDNTLAAKDLPEP